MPVGGDTCVKVLNCCRRTACCPGTVLPDTLDAVVTSTCAALNGTVTLTRTGGPNDPACWTGTLPISGCFDCDTLRVDLCCLEEATGTGTGVVYRWDVAWAVFHSGGPTLCVVTSVEGGLDSLTDDCGPPLSVTLVQDGLILTDPVPPGGTCCTGFTITIDVEGPP